MHLTNKNVDIKCCAHDTFLEFHQVRSKSKDYLQLWEQYNQNS